jgi:hypothetical protein
MNASKCIRFFSRCFFVLPLALTLSACDPGDQGDDLPGDSSETGASTNTEGASSNTHEPVENTTDEPGASVLDEAPAVFAAESDGSVNAEGLCPYRYQCGGVNGLWYSTSAGCTAVCATTCSKHEYNNGHCIPR